MLFWYSTLVTGNANYRMTQTSFTLMGFTQPQTALHIIEDAQNNAKGFTSRLLWLRMMCYSRKWHRHTRKKIRVLLSGVEPKTFRLLVRMLVLVRTSNRKVLGSTPDRSTRIFFPSMPVSLSGITHHSHSFTRLEIYHHIYFITVVLSKASILQFKRHWFDPRGKCASERL